jgi:GNAT superfamily N-acetyltransferase
MRATTIAAFQRNFCTFQSTRAGLPSFFPKHLPTDGMDVIDGILIRPIGSRDAAQASQIWVQGLKQTSESLPEERREEVEGFFRDYARKECEEGGGMGPDGMGLIQTWYHDATGNIDRDCRMFVAVREDAGTADGERDTPPTHVVLGLVGVKRGMDSKEFPTDASKEDYAVFSIWRMSVSEDARGLGLGCKLMTAAEQWAKGRPNAQVMRLYTGNPIAAKFYTSEKVGYREIVKEPHFGTYEKKLK